MGRGLLDAWWRLRGWMRRHPWGFAAGFSGIGGLVIAVVSAASQRDLGRAIALGLGIGVFLFLAMGLAGTVLFRAEQAVTALAQRPRMSSRPFSWVVPSSVASGLVVGAVVTLVRLGRGETVLSSAGIGALIVGASAALGAVAKVIVGRFRGSPPRNGSA